jgi:hypothetical protein
MQKRTLWLVLMVALVLLVQTGATSNNSLIGKVQAASSDPYPWQTGVEQTTTLRQAEVVTSTTTTTPTQSSVSPTTTNITPTVLITPAVIIRPLTNGAPITTAIPLTVVQPITQTTSPAAPNDLLQGTVIANRTEAAVRFFIEGETYELAPLSTESLALPRETAVLNLFNCDARTPETQEGCFWDPYLLNRDGFYELVSGQVAKKTVSLVLQEAGAPPINQIWVQNRSSDSEILFYNEQQYELPPAAVQEFTGQPDAPITLYIRSCLELSERTVCEWYPQSVDTGVYYALTQINTAGAVPGSRVQVIQLQPLVSSDPASPVVKTPPQVICNLVVPAINVRSGPGLQYEIVSKVRGTEAEPGTVLVIGRDESNTWLAVDDRVATGGWITGSSNFVKCNGDTSTLPVAEIVDGRLAAPTPAPEGQAAAPTSDTAAPAEPIDEPSAPITSTIPDGLALIIVNNGFDQIVRFTLDQRYRVEQGVSEYDLQPGQSTSFLVYPGQIAFTASTPWRGLSGNADFFIDKKESRTLWLTFVPDPDGSGRWLLQY